MSAGMSPGCRVVISSLLHSHAATRSARDLVGRSGLVVRLIPRGGSLYALVDLDDEIRGYPGQRRWPVHVDDLVLVSSPSAAHAERVPFIVGIEPFPAGSPTRSVRHAVPRDQSDRERVKAVCRRSVRPVRSTIGLLAFDPGSALACPECADLGHQA